MRSPFDTSDVAWWAIHGASMSAPPPSSIDLERFAIEALADELLAMPARDTMIDPSASAEREGLSLQEFLEATERETVRDVSLVRTAAALEA